MLPDNFSISACLSWKNQTETEFHQSFEAFAAGGAKFFLTDAKFLHQAITGQPEVLKNIVRIAGEYGLILRDSHATWGGTGINTGMGDVNDLNELNTDAHIRKHETALHCLGEYGVKTFVIHPGAWCSYNRSWFGHEEEYRTVAYKALERLLKTAEAEKIVIAVENIFEPSTNAFEVRNLVQRFRSPYLGLCLDCGHANLMEPRPGRQDTDLVNYIQDAWKPVGAINYIAGIPELMMPDLVTVHVHDNNARNDEHKDLDGTGTIDWARYAAVFAKAPRLISLQSEVGYQSVSELPQITAHLKALSDRIAAL